MAFGLAVYASQCPVTRTPRKTRFRPLVRRYRTGFYPQGSVERFQICFLHLILLSQASLGAIDATSASKRVWQPRPPARETPLMREACQSLVREIVREVVTHGKVKQCRKEVNARGLFTVRSR